MDLAKLTGILNGAIQGRARDTSSRTTTASRPSSWSSTSRPGRSPRGARASDGSRAYVANSLDDDVAGDRSRDAWRPTARIDLGGPKSSHQARYGERLFHSANIAFRKQFACHSCHPDGHVDGLTYDIEADGIGVSPVDNRTLRGILDTAPFKWEGTNPSLTAPVRRAPRHVLHAPRAVHRRRTRTRSTTTSPPSSARPIATARLVRRLHPGPAPRQADLRAHHTQRRARHPARRPLRHLPLRRPTSPTARCTTSARKTELDRSGKFDVPHLNNIYDSAPYLHNGMAATLEEIWTVYNPNDKHGVTNDHDQGSAQRPDRVHQDAVRGAHMINQATIALLAAAGLLAAADSAAEETSLRVHEVEALHDGGRPAQRPHLRRQGRRQRTSGSAPRTAWR